VNTGKSFYKFIILYQDLVVLTIIICIVVIGSHSRLSTVKIVTGFQEKKSTNTKAIKVRYCIATLTSSLNNSV